MCTKGGSTVRRFASNGLGSTPRRTLGKPQRYTVTPFHSHLLFLTRLPDFLQGGCGVETLGTPEHCPPPWYHLDSTTAHLGMDARRRLDGIHQEMSWCRPTQSCKYPCCRVLSRVNSRHQLSDVTEGLHFLHSRNIVHGDLKGVRD